MTGKRANYFVIVMYFLATVSFTVVVTHCLTRLSIADRQKDMVQKLQIEMRSEPQEKQQKYFMLTRSLSMQTGGLCLGSMFFLVPGITFLYGAISSHQFLKHKIELHLWPKLLEMTGLLILLLLLYGLAIPC